MEGLIPLTPQYQEVRLNLIRHILPIRLIRRIQPILHIQPIQFIQAIPLTLLVVTITMAGSGRISASTAVFQDL